MGRTLTNDKGRENRRSDCEFQGPWEAGAVPSQWPGPKEQDASAKSARNMFEGRLTLLDTPSKKTADLGRFEVGGIGMHE